VDLGIIDQYRAEVERGLKGVSLRPLPSAELVEKLTDRERSILRLLRSDLTQRQIASEIYVSFNTMKTHTRSLYRKLGASSRREALERARELGLL
jgi:LuxR family maltose regulon positive regulatory protein